MMSQSRPPAMAVVATAPMGVAMIDGEGMLRSGNEEALKIFGQAIAGGATVSSALASIAYRAGTDERYPEASLPIAAALRGEAQMVDDLEIEHGSERCALQIWARPLAEADDGTVVLWLQDITARKRMEVERLHAQKLESIGGLAAGVAHEINTPTQYVNDNVHFAKAGFERLLGAVEAFNSYVEDTRDEHPDEAKKLARALRRAKLDYLREELPKALDQTIEGLTKVSGIVGAMKEFSHPGAEGKALTNINRVLEMTMTVSRNEWKYVAELQLNLDADLPEVPCLRDELGQAFLNIIVNAAHAIESHRDEGDMGVIEITTALLEDEWVEIRIRDTGGGIPEAAQARVFDPFFTTKAVGKGTGQGLPISRSVVVDKHDGELFFEVERGVGTCFVMRLPTQTRASRPEAACA